MAAPETYAKQPSPAHQDAKKIKGEIDNILSKMNKNPSYTPTRDELEACAEKIIKFINKNHAQVASFQSHLKAAIIDLTEVPEMSPQMQRISFFTALKDASAKMELFLSCC